MNEFFSKQKELENQLKSLGSAAVAFSAGVDSTYLLRVASEVLGKNLLAITAKAPCFPMRETQRAIDFCKKENIRLIVFDFNPFETEGYSNNPENRCYICKKALFSQIISIAKENGITNIIEGTNLDDLSDYRPGRKALEELNIISPLLESKLTKNEIRILSEELGLETYDQPSFACLSTRIPYGEEITEKKLLTIEKAENKLSELGFKQYRVRHHGTVARIEINEEDLEKALKEKEIIIHHFKSLGFKYITLDLEGFRSGSMNETGI